MTMPYSDSSPILSVRHLKVHFKHSSTRLFHRTPRYVKAIDDISFDLNAGETLGIVGESGCGKSTLGRAILQLIPNTSGKVLWMGNDLNGLTQQQMRHYRQDLQIIFQDPLASLNPRMTIGEIIAEPLRTFKPEYNHSQRTDMVRDMMQKVGLLPIMINRYPHEFSGGQCQRIGIARAMILSPKLIICDEPVSALDVSIQAQIITLLTSLQAQFGLSLLFISHDLSVIHHLCHRVLVLYLGKIMELSSAEDFFKQPLHPYSQALTSAILAPDPRHKNTSRIVLQGDLPSPLDPPSGCVFRTRCPSATTQCTINVPDLREISTHRSVACHLFNKSEEA